MALNLTGIGGRLIGTKRPAAAVRTVGPTKTTVTSAAALSGTLSGGIQKRPPTVLGNASRIIKIHPSQLVSLGGGRVSVSNQWERFSRASVSPSSHSAAKLSLMRDRWPKLYDWTAQQCSSEKKNSEVLFSSVLSQSKKYHTSGNLKFHYLGIFQSLKFRILMEKVLPIILKLLFLVLLNLGWQHHWNKGASSYRKTSVVPT